MLGPLSNPCEGGDGFSFGPPLLLALGFTRDGEGLEFWFVFGDLEFRFVFGDLEFWIVFGDLPLLVPLLVPLL